MGDPTAARVEPGSLAVALIAAPVFVLGTAVTSYAEWRTVQGYPPVLLAGVGWLAWALLARLLLRGLVRTISASDRLRVAAGAGIATVMPFGVTLYAMTRVSFVVVGVASIATAGVGSLLGRPKDRTPVFWGLLGLLCTLGALAILVGSSLLDPATPAGALLLVMPLAVTAGRRLEASVPEEEATQAQPDGWLAGAMVLVLAGLARGETFGGVTWYATAGALLFWGAVLAVMAAGVCLRGRDRLSAVLASLHPFVLVLIGRLVVPVPDEVWGAAACMSGALLVKAAPRKRS